MIPIIILILISSLIE